MRRLSFLAAAAARAAAHAAAAVPVTLSECVRIETDPSNPTVTTWVHDLTTLYTNGSGHTFINRTTGQMFVFEICGGAVQPSVPTDKTGVCTPGSVYNSGTPCTIDSTNVAVPGTEKQSYTYCNADYNSYPFAGRFMQFLEFTDNSVTPPVTYGNGGRPTCVLGGSPNKGFRPQDVANSTGFQNFCSTGQCDILSSPAIPQISLLDESDPSTGVVIKYGGSIADQGDDFVCPTDPYTGFARQRLATITLKCVPGLETDPLQIYNVFDDGACDYTVLAGHPSACGRASNCDLGRPSARKLDASAPVSLSPVSADSCLLFELDPNDPGKVGYVYDLRPVSTGGRGYTFYNQSTMQYFAFELCGGPIKPVVPTDPANNCNPEIAYQNSAQSRYGYAPDPGWPGVTPPQGCLMPGTHPETFTYCNAEYSTYPYVGNVIMFLEYRPGQPSKFQQCQLGGQPGTKAGLWTPPNSLNASGYASYCATSQCMIYGSGASTIRALDPSNQTAGVAITFAGSMPDDGDEFVCPMDPFTGYAQRRTTTINVHCTEGDPARMPLQIYNVYDNNGCALVVETGHPSACGYEATCPI